MKSEGEVRARLEEIKTESGFIVLHNSFHISCWIEALEWVLKKDKWTSEADKEEDEWVNTPKS